MSEISALIPKHFMKVL